MLVSQGRYAMRHGRGSKNWREVERGLEVSGEVVGESDVGSEGKGGGGGGAKGRGAKGRGGKRKQKIGKVRR